MNATGPYWWSVNIGSGNGLVAPGNKYCLSQCDPYLCRHMASLGHNELNDTTTWGNGATVKPVCNDHLYDKIYYLWSIQ